MTTLTLLQLNDLHGYLEPHPELVRTEGGWRSNGWAGSPASPVSSKRRAPKVRA